MRKSRDPKDTIEHNRPLRLWDYCTELIATTHELTSIDAFKLQGLTPYATLVGQQADSINSCQFGQLEWNRDHKKSFPEHKERLGKELGSSKGVGNDMCQ